MRHLVQRVDPNIAGIADDIAVIKTVNTEAINHDRPSRSSRLDSSSRAGLAPARVELWTGIDEPEPARLRGHDFNGKRAINRSTRVCGARDFMPSEYQGAASRVRAIRFFILESAGIDNHRAPPDA